jgi:hypothetical protein
MYALVNKACKAYEIPLVYLGPCSELALGKSFMFRIAAFFCLLVWKFSELEMLQLN